MKQILDLIGWDEKRKLAVERFLNIDNEILEHKPLMKRLDDHKDITAYFEIRLCSLYESLYQYLIYGRPAFMKNAERIMWDMAAFVIVQYGKSVVPKTLDIFKKKNDSRSSCWINVGVFGQIAEIHAKCERLMTDIENDEDTKDDAWLDLYNYCKFGIVCCEMKLFVPIYMNFKSPYGD